MEIDFMLAKKLISSQFPQWESLLIQPVKQSGWDNRTFHLGEEMTIRLPSNEEYAPQILKEFHWLPILGKGISLQITTPIGLGQPCEYFPWHWSINRWIEGETASVECIRNLSQFAEDLGSPFRQNEMAFLDQLQIHGEIRCFLYHIEFCVANYFTHALYLNTQSYCQAFYSYDD